MGSAVNAKLAKFGNIIKFSKHGAVAEYDPWRFQIFVGFALSLTVSEIRTSFEKMAKFIKKICFALFLLLLYLLPFPR